MSDFACILKTPDQSGSGAFAEGPCVRGGCDRGMLAQGAERYGECFMQKQSKGAEILNMKEEVAKWKS